MSISFNPDGSGIITAPSGHAIGFSAGITPSDLSALMTAFLKSDAAGGAIGGGGGVVTTTPSDFEVQMTRLLGELDRRGMGVITT